MLEAPLEERVYNFEEWQCDCEKIPKGADPIDFLIYGEARYLDEQALLDKCLETGLLEKEITKPK